MRSPGAPFIGLNSTGLVEYVTLCIVLRYVANRKKQSSGGRDNAENLRHDASVSPDNNDADKSPYDVPTGTTDIHVYALPNNTRRL